MTHQEQRFYSRYAVQQPFGVDERFNFRDSFSRKSSSVFLTMTNPFFSKIQEAAISGGY
jgi:hypothetical protein